MKIVENAVSRSVAVAAGVVVAAWAAPAAANGLGAMFGAAGTGLEKVPAALQVAMWVAGLGLFIWGWIKMRRSGGGPGRGVLRRLRLRSRPTKMRGRMKKEESFLSRPVAVAAGVVVAAWAAPAAAKDLGTMFESLGTGLEKVPTALTTLMWVLGLGVFIWGLVKLRRSGDGAREQTSGGAWATVLVGVAFALGPLALGFFPATFGFGEAGTGRPTWGTGG